MVAQSEWKEWHEGQLHDEIRLYELQEHTYATEEEVQDQQQEWPSYSIHMTIFWI